MKQLFVSWCLKIDMCEFDHIFGLNEGLQTPDCIPRSAYKDIDFGWTVLSRRSFGSKLFFNYVSHGALRKCSTSL